MKYRIIEEAAPWRGENAKDFIVQVKYKFLPFWIKLTPYRNNTLEKAKNEISQYNKFINTPKVIHEINIQTLAAVQGEQ